MVLTTLGITAWMVNQRSSLVSWMGGVTTSQFAELAANHLSYDGFTTVQDGTREVQWDRGVSKTVIVTNSASLSVTDTSLLIATLQARGAPEPTAREDRYVKVESRIFLDGVEVMRDQSGFDGAARVELSSSATFIMELSPGDYLLEGRGVYQNMEVRNNEGPVLRFALVRTEDAAPGVKGARR